MQRAEDVWEKVNLISTKDYCRILLWWESLGFGSPACSEVEGTKPGVSHISFVAGESLCMKIYHENLLLMSSHSVPEQLKLSIFLRNFYTLGEMRICSLPDIWYCSTWNIICKLFHSTGMNVLLRALGFSAVFVSCNWCDIWESRSHTFFSIQNNEPTFLNSKLSSLIR